MAVVVKVVVPLKSTLAVTACGAAFRMVYVNVALSVATVAVRPVVVVPSLIETEHVFWSSTEVLSVYTSFTVSPRASPAVTGT